MTNKAKKSEPTITIVDDSVVLQNAAFDAGYEKARQDMLRVMLSAQDNMGHTFADALYVAGADKDGTFWLSVAARDAGLPTHILNSISKLFRNNRKLSISAIPPYRVTKNF